MIHLVKQYLSEVFESNSFEIIEENNSLIRYKNSANNMIVGFSIDHIRGNEFDMYIQFKDNYFTLQDLLFLDPTIEKEIGGNLTSINIAQSTLLAIKKLFLMNSSSILSGENIVMNAIKFHSIERSIAYNSNLEKLQVLSDAERAWNNKDYNNLIHILDLFNEPLNTVWKKRYEFAKKQL